MLSVSPAPASRRPEPRTQGPFARSPSLTSPVLWPGSPAPDCRMHTVLCSSSSPGLPGAAQGVPPPLRVRGKLQSPRVDIPGRAKDGAAAAGGGQRLQLENHDPCGRCSARWFCLFSHFHERLRCAQHCPGTCHSARKVTRGRREGFPPQSRRCDYRALVFSCSRACWAGRGGPQHVRGCLAGRGQGQPGGRARPRQPRPR